MGFVNDTSMCKFISPLDAVFSAGTWTPTLTSNVLAQVRTANDSSFTCFIPIDIPSKSVALKGALLKSIDVYYAIGTAAADDFATVELEKMTLGVDDVAITGAAVTTTCDAGHDTAAERYAVDTDHVMTVTLTTPVWFDDGDAMVLELIVDCAATTVFSLFGARANYTLRV
jgi:hypothetical protein